LTQQEIIKKLKIIKVTSEIDIQFIADYLGMTNARSVANFLHGDYNLSDEKRRKAEELIDLFKTQRLDSIKAKLQRNGYKYTTQ
jgi:hypothetical protein